MDFITLGMLFGAAAVAGMINSVAGGGSFVSFPALLLAGMPPIAANATNATALWPGSLASVGAYRSELRQQRGEMRRLSIVSLIGGLIGALLLLRTREALFAQLVPYLLLIATLIFVASPWLTRLARQVGTNHSGGKWQRSAVLGLYFLVAIYGGFFGAGLGILMLATLALLGQENIHEMNALKTLQASIVNGIAVITFVLARIVEWPVAVVMIAGAIVGGYGGAAIARQIKPRYVRWLVIVISVSLTIYFFVASL